MFCLASTILSAYIITVVDTWTKTSLLSTVAFLNVVKCDADGFWSFPVQRRRLKNSVGRALSSFTLLKRPWGMAYSRLQDLKIP